MKVYAPIIIFAFNRVSSLMNSIASLQQNTEAGESDLFIFIDGPRLNKKGEMQQVQEVRNFVSSISGFKTINCYFSELNKGLGPSIIAGVTEIINKYGKAIVLEDDLVFANNFLSFMNQGLEKYENVQRVFSVCGYSNKIKVPKSYLADAYFAPRSSSWGWATWADRWNTVDWELKDWSAVRTNSKRFNKWGGSDCFGMLQGWKDKCNNSWAIRFCYSQFVQDRLALFPVVSKDRNDGFDGQGTNCKSWSRFKCEFDESTRKDFVYPLTIEINKTILKSFLFYNSSFLRVWSRIMYLIYK